MHIGRVAASTAACIGAVAVSTEAGIDAVASTVGASGRSSEPGGRRELGTVVGVEMVCRCGVGRRMGVSCSGEGAGKWSLRK